MIDGKSWTTAAVTLALLLPVHGAKAQTFEDTASGRDSRVSVGISIPFGARTKREEAPQVQMTFDRKRVGEMEWQVPTTGLTPRRKSMATTLSLSLDGERRMSLNGREFTAPDGKRNLSDGAAIGIGVAVGVAALVAVAFAGGGDDVEDDECFFFCDP